MRSRSAVTRGSVSGTAGKRLDATTATCEAGSAFGGEADGTYPTSGSNASARAGDPWRGSATSAGPGVVPDGPRIAGATVARACSAAFAPPVAGAGGDDGAGDTRTS